MRFTAYFHSTRQRTDRAGISLVWIREVMDHPTHEQVQQDGRIRRRAPVAESGGKYLRVILLADGETVHNAFFDRSFKP